MQAFSIDIGPVDFVVAVEVYRSIDYLILLSTKKNKVYDSNMQECSLQSKCLEMKKSQLNGVVVNNVR